MTQGTIKKFTDLVAWQEAHVLVLLIYKTTAHFPADERFGITNQMRRAVISITSNIAEGFGRETAKDKAHFYTMAKTSLAELENQGIAARDLKYMNTESFTLFEQQAEKVNRLLAGLYKSATLVSRSHT